MKIGLCIPTFNAEAELVRSIPVIVQAGKCLSRTLVIDSSSTDATATMLRKTNIDVYAIPGVEFDHGGTRQMAVDRMDDCDIVVFLTQDAIPTSAESIRRLIAVFDDPKVAIAYGRQIPRPKAKPIEAHARLFGYPNQSRIKSKDSIPELGLRAATVSNSFAAYRRSTLLELGGFPKGTLFGEDTLTGAKAILAGYKIAYVAEATVYHSHNYTLIQEFRRYFDNGVFYSREKWILDAFGKAEGSGKAYVLSEIRYLLRKAPWLLPVSFLTVFVKYLGYRMGAFERHLPARWKLHMSMNKAFWKREMALLNRVGSD